MTNPTDATEIVRHFLTKTDNLKAESTVYQRCMVTAKQLLKTYNKRQVIKVIDHVIDVKKVHIHSFGYIVKVMCDALRELEAIRVQEESKRAVEDMYATLDTTQEEVDYDSESGKRNRTKAARLGIQSSIREKYLSDLHEGQ